MNKVAFQKKIVEKRDHINIFKDFYAKDKNSKVGSRKFDHFYF